MILGHFTTPSMNLIKNPIFNRHKVSWCHNGAIRI